MRCRLSIRRFCCAACSLAGSILPDKDIDELAHAIFDRVEWNWLSEDTSLLSHGWKPELGFIPVAMGFL